MKNKLFKLMLLTLVLSVVPAYSCSGISFNLFTPNDRCEYGEETQRVFVHNFTNAECEYQRTTTIDYYSDRTELHILWDILYFNGTTLEVEDSTTDNRVCEFEDDDSSSNSTSSSSSGGGSKDGGGSHIWSAKIYNPLAVDWNNSVMPDGPFVSLNGTPMYKHQRCNEGFCYDIYSANQEENY